MNRFFAQTDEQCHNCGSECPRGSVIFTTEDEIYCQDCGDKEIDLEDLKIDNQNDV